MQKKGIKLHQKQADKTRVSMEKAFPFKIQGQNSQEEESDYEEGQIETKQYSQRKLRQAQQEEAPLRQSIGLRTRAQMAIDSSPVPEQNKRNIEKGSQINQVNPFGFGRDKFQQRNVNNNDQGRQSQEGDLRSLPTKVIDLSFQDDFYDEQSPPPPAVPLRQKKPNEIMYPLSDTRQLNIKESVLPPIRTESSLNLSTQMKNKPNSEGKNDISPTDFEKMSKLLSIQAEGLKLKQQQLMRINCLVSQFGGQAPQKKLKVDEGCYSQQTSRQQSNQQYENNFEIIENDENDQEISQMNNQQKNQRIGVTPTKINMFSLPQLRQYQQNQMNSLQQKQQSQMPANPTQLLENGNPFFGNFNALLGNMNGYLGKITPGNFNPMSSGFIKTPPLPPLPQGKSTPMRNNYGDSTPIKKRLPDMNTQQHHNQNSQNNYIDIESEIQARIESIKSEIGPLLACLNSDLISNIQNPKQNQQNITQCQNEEQSQEDIQMNIHESRIYQDMKDRRMNEQYQSNQKRSPPTQNSLRGRNATPIKGSRRNEEFGSNRTVTPTRMPPQSRVGDWFCFSCKNINFSYRDICNRCGKPQEQEGNTVCGDDEANLPISTQNQNNSTNKYNNQNFINNNNTNNNNNFDDTIYKNQYRPNFYSNNNSNYYDYFNNQMSQNPGSKTPIRTVDDVKRSFQESQSNKENINEGSNLGNIKPNNLNFGFQEKKVEQTKQIYGIKKAPLSYKQLVDQGSEVDPIIVNSSNIIGEKGNFQNENSNNNNNNQRNVVSHKIVFIDNSSAMPLREVKETARENSSKAQIR